MSRVGRFVMTIALLLTASAPAYAQFTQSVKAGAGVPLAQFGDEAGVGWTIGWDGGWAFTPRVNVGVSYDFVKYGGKELAPAVKTSPSSHLLAVKGTVGVFRGPAAPRIDMGAALGFVRTNVMDGGPSTNKPALMLGLRATKDTAGKLAPFGEVRYVHTLDGDLGKSFLINGGVKFGM